MPIINKFDKSLGNLDTVHHGIRARLTTWRYSRPKVSSETLLAAQGEAVPGIDGQDQREADREVKRAASQAYAMRQATRDLVQQYVDNIFAILDAPEE
jgi:hypothetical protein